MIFLGFRKSGCCEIIGSRTGTATHTNTAEMSKGVMNWRTVTLFVMGYLVL